MRQCPRADDFGRAASHGSLYLSKVEEIDRETVLLPYAHYLKQAWSEIGLAGVLCVDGRPTVYFCEAVTFDADTIRSKQQFVWNQGIVPLFVLLSDSEVQIHSAVKKPARTDGSDDLFPDKSESSLIQDVELVSEAVGCAKLVRSIETGQFFQDHAKFFPATETVDACLVENLLFTARKLDNVKSPGWSKDRSHALIGRMLFVMFLHERGFIKEHHYPKGTGSLLDILKAPNMEEAKRLLYGEFFPLLKREFNGTMFDDDLEREERLIRRAHLETLKGFLSGDDMAREQMTLGFWAYDFKTIPVEIISSIYEEFMKGEDPKKKRKDGAVYTPRHLAETTLQVALENRYDQSACWKVLDPACGSAIFLVAMFNLLSAQWQRANPTARKATKAKGLLHILQHQIRGVEINPGACRIAAFSLYLALFEKLQPIDLDEFKETVRKDRFLPSLIWQKDAGTQPEQPVIIQGDFLKDELPVGSDFDLIIGNPPWEGRATTQLALHFTRKTRDHLKDNGIACLLLPSAILVNKNGSLDAEFFRSVRVEKMVQLADFRKLLFNAIHPCFALRFAKQRPALDDVVTYETPKLNRYDRRRGVIVVEPDDQKHIALRDMLGTAQSSLFQSQWTRKFWGSPRDEALLSRLDCYPTLAEIKQRKHWSSGVGFKPYYPDVSRDAPKKLEPDWSPNDKYLPNTDDFPQLVISPSDLSTLKAGLEKLFVTKQDRSTPGSLRVVRAACDSVQYKPNQSIFTPPMLLLSNGFTKFAFCSHRVRFQDSLRSITSKTKSDEPILRFLAAVLDSPLMAYHAFHCGSSNGIGRTKLHLHESLSLPCPLPDDDLAVENADEIVAEASGILKDLEKAGAKASGDTRDTLAANARKRLRPLIEAYYRITDEERYLIDDTLKLWKPSIHQTNLDADIPALAFPEEPERRAYATLLCTELNKFSRKKLMPIRAIGRASKEFGLIMMTVVFGGSKADYAEEPNDEKFWQALERMNDVAQRENGRLHYLRGFSYFESDRVHILKPATMRNWSKTAALNDADAIYEHQQTRPA